MGNSLPKPIIAILLFPAAFISVGIFLLSLSPTHGQAVQDTTRTHELMGLQLSKEQVQPRRTRQRRFPQHGGLCDRQF